MAERQGAWLASATLLLILLGLVGVVLRQGSDRLQAIPALTIGIALLVHNRWSWHRRRRALLQQLRDR